MHRLCVLSDFSLRHAASPLGLNETSSIPHDDVPGVLDLVMFSAAVALESLRRHSKKVADTVRKR